MREIEHDYAANVGREHRNLPPDHPGCWQWEYRGSKDEREALLKRLSGEEAPIPVEQASLFDA